MLTVESLTSSRFFLINKSLILNDAIPVASNSYNMIKQLLTNLLTDPRLISTIDYQYCSRLSPRSILVSSGGYHVISNNTIVNNCIVSTTHLLTKTDMLLK